MKLKKLMREWILDGVNESDKLEIDFFQLNEIKIDSLNSYNYEEVNIPLYTKAYKFEDRCGNVIIAVYIESINEFKTGYKIDDVDSLIFQPELLDNVEELIRPCADDKKVGTVYKILSKEIIPHYLLNKKPNKIFFNPVTDSRARLVDMIINKAIKDYPQLTKNKSYIIHK
jgi:hypothetical protein